MGVLGHVIRELSRPMLSVIKDTARSTHRFVKAIEPWGIGLAVLGFGLSALVLVIDLEDRQAERTFRAWEVVLSSQYNPNGRNSMKLALEYLNRQYTPPPWLCGKWIRSISTQLTGNLSRTCFIPKKDRASFRDAKFSNAFLFNVNLQNALLENANLTNANLTNSNLREANLREANLLKTNLREANLTNAFLLNANLDNANLTNANLPNANLENANVENANLREANLREANLTNAFLLNANLENANLMEANLENANLENVNLANARVTQAQLDVACAHPKFPPSNLPRELTWNRKPCPS
ncbi:MAG: hypothetical protein NPIRA05_04050 [Nitrospirales bacterium]|nr:MAG: hypothetical protein NPIRA05_04050 [Nitrospirales bacterium]